MDDHQGFRVAALDAAKWNAIGQGTRQLVAFFISIALARLVTPREFGLLAMLFIFQEIANAFVNSGLNAPLIQSPEISEEDCSTVFHFNLAVSILCYGALVLTAPYIAAFYREPQLETIIALYGLAFVIHALGNVQAALLIRHLDFRRMNIVMLVAVAVSGALAVGMALRGFGVYSLLGQHISFALVTNGLYWRLSAWRPSRRFSLTAFRRLFGSGSRVLAVSMADKIMGTVDDLLIGRLQGTAFLGQYSRGKTTRDLPLTQVNGVLTSMVFPLFSRIRDTAALRGTLLRFIGVVSYLTAPLMVGMWLVAEPLIVTLYSESWRPAVPFLRLFCLFGITLPLSSILVQTVMARGEYQRFLRLEVAKKAVLITAMGVGILFGPKGLVWGLCIAHYLALAMSLGLVAHLLETSALGLTASVLPAVGLALLMAVPVQMTLLLPWTSVAASLVTAVAVGVLAYWGLSALVRSADYVYLRDSVLTYLR